MRKADLYDLTFREFDNKSIGFFNKFKEGCERERMWVGLIISSQQGIKKNFNINKLIPFSWEKKIVKVDKKAAKESLERIKKRDKWQTKS